jgi:hypothetical protein
MVQVEFVAEGVKEKLGDGSAHPNGECRARKLTGSL